MDPSDILFSHSKICPIFSGCKKSVEDTFTEIQNGMLKVTDLPIITIIKNDKGDIISLNNRRLWVLKKCKKTSFLDTVHVNTKNFTKFSKKEQERYNTNTYVSTAKLDKKLIRKNSKL